MEKKELPEAPQPQYRCAECNTAYEGKRFSQYNKDFCTLTCRDEYFKREIKPKHDAEAKRLAEAQKRSSGGSYSSGGAPCH
jgi:hypothetical protein